MVESRNGLFGPRLKASTRKVIIRFVPRGACFFRSNKNGSIRNLFSISKEMSIAWMRVKTQAGTCSFFSLSFNLDCGICFLFSLACTFRNIFREFHELLEDGPVCIFESW